MSDLALLGKIASICVGVVAYIIGWFITVDCIDGDYCFGEVLTKIFSAIWVVFHIILLISWFIWSWNYNI